MTPQARYRLLLYSKDKKEGKIIYDVNSWWFNFDGHFMFEEVGHATTVKQISNIGGWQLAERSAN